VLLLAGVLAVVFAYLEVPVWNAVLFAVAVVLQAAFGTVVLTRLLTGLGSSLTLLLGPGLIVGGALSFAVFQLVGRGWFGIVAVTLVGGWSVVLLSGAADWQMSTQRLWMIGQVLGLGALALTWEFGELLPVAVAFFFLGFLTSNTPKLPRIAQAAACAAAAALIITPLVLRQDYWWLVTDDYRFFEVLATHITNSGPFADWGAMNWSRYHWLSYGWSGLLNELGGQPEPFTTLTRIMPITYSASLAASLIHLTKHLTNNTLTPLALTPAWTILALNPLDWSGTSTAGIYPVITALTATTIPALTTHQSPIRRLVLYAGFLPIVALTKLPGMFAVACSLLILEVAARRTRSRPTTLAIALLATYVAVSIGTLTAIWLTSRTLGGFELVTVNVGLGELASFGRNYAILFLTLQHLPLLITLLITGMLLTKAKPANTNTSTNLILLAPQAFIGFILATIIYAPADNYRYFSQPFIFLASLGLLAATTTIKPIPHKQHLMHILAIPALFTIGKLWVTYDGSIKLWTIIGEQLFTWNSNRTALLQYVTGDSRALAVLVFLCCVVLCVTFRRRRLQPQVWALLMSVVFLTTISSLLAIGRVIREPTTKEEVEQVIGSKELRATANWLFGRDPIHKLIATNFLFYDDSQRLPSSDFSMSAWSQREFLVLGPRFAADNQDLQTAVRLSLSYAENPTEELAAELRQRDVRWFVVDKFKTTYREWRLTTNVMYENERFLVVQL